jgi:hypothetical protein
MAGGVMAVPTACRLFAGDHPADDSAIPSFCGCNSGSEDASTGHGLCEFLHQRLEPVRRHVRDQFIEYPSWSSGRAWRWMTIGMKDQEIRAAPDRRWGVRAKCMALRKAAKPAKVAIIAIMRKLVVIANTVLRDNRKWTFEAA